jgi:hypothetical protein
MFKSKLRIAIIERDSAVARVSILEATLVEKPSPSLDGKFSIPTTFSPSTAQ